MTFAMVKLVILGVQRLSSKPNGRAVGGPVHYVQCELYILDILSKHSLKIFQIYLNMLKYTQIFPCWAGTKVYRA
jgi:hypothetical protein